MCKACFVENNRKCVWIHSVAEILHAARWKMSKNPVRRRPFNPGQYAPLQLSRWHRKLLLDQISWMLKLEWAQTNYVSFSFNIPTVSLIPEEVNFRFEKKHFELNGAHYQIKIWQSFEFDCLFQYIFTDNQFDLRQFRISLLT